MTDVKLCSKGELEYIRSQSKQRFDKVRGTWVDLGKWALPHRIKWLLSQTEGERNNQHIVDTTHVLALRSYVAGFLEGNTSASRPWFRSGTDDREKDLIPQNHEWLDLLTKRCLITLSNANFYHSAGEFYYDFGTFNTGGYYIDERKGGNLFFHVMIPGSYYVMNNNYGEAVVLVREISMSVKALVDYYGRKVNGMPDWSNFSSRVKTMYENANYAQRIDVVQVIKENTDYNPGGRQGGANRRWISMTYELGGGSGPYYQDGQEFGAGFTPDKNDKEKFLSIKFSKRKPFIVGRSFTSGNFEYGEKGPTIDSLGLIKSLNKKAIGKDQALEQMLRPALQGPANLKKSYITTASNAYVPLDATSLAQKGLRTVFEVNPGIGNLVQDVSDLRQQVDKHYYADYLLYLTMNPKTRTATETDAVVQEQQLIIGPNLQSLNATHNAPIVEYVMDYVLDNDPHLPPPPKQLAGSFLRTEFISVFAQAQKAADLPSIDRYMQMMETVGQLRPEIWFKANLDKLADIYEDRLYLPPGLNRPTEQANALMQQAQAEAQKRQQMEQMTQMAGAAKDMGIQANQKGVQK